MRPMITIGITAFNEEKTIGKCLESILSQNVRKPYEILVSVPDKATQKVVKSYTKKFSNIRLIKDPGLGKPVALNLIFKYAKGDIIVLTDGDVFLGKNSIFYLLSHFKDEKVGAVSGRVIPITSGFFADWFKITNKAIHTQNVIENKNNIFWSISGYLFALRKEVTVTLPPNIFVDDAFIGWKIRQKGRKILYEPRAKVYVKFPLTIKDFIKQTARVKVGHYQLTQIYRASFFPRRKGLFKQYFIRAPMLIKLKILFYFLFYIVSWLYGYCLILSRAKFHEIWKPIKTTK